MPLNAPILDNREFDQIFEQIRSRISRYTPEWTDYNPSDPGITLLELFAWLAEAMLFQMNRIPDRNYVKFLKLLNLELSPPTPATAHLTFSPRKDARVSSIPIRTRVAAQSPATGQLVPFETQVGLDLIPYPLSDIQVFNGSTFQVRSEENLSTVGSYFPFGSKPQAGSALYLGFTPPDELPGPGELYFPGRLRFRVFLPQAATAGEPQRCSPRAAGLPPAPPVTLVWEYRHVDPPFRWRSLTVYQDDSAAFTRAGDVVLEGPSKMIASNEGRLIDPAEEKRFWLRCRMAKESYPIGKEPCIDFIRINTVPALSATTVKDEIIGYSDGTPHQTFQLRHFPIIPESQTDESNAAGGFELYLEKEGEENQIWRPVADFLSSGPDDLHFVLKAASGILQFGDGEYGRIPTGGGKLVAVSYRYGGGAAANVTAGSIVIPLSTLTGVDSVINERPAVGGRDEETVEDLKAKAPCVLRHRNRAVTAEDFAALARNAGGIADATALTETHPDYPGVAVPGAVTVVVLPDHGEIPPKPSADLIRHVCGYLEDYRLITTELHVKGPEFVEIRVMVNVKATPRMSQGTVKQLIQTALDARLDPLEWEFGRDFNPTGLYRDIYRVTDDLGNEVVKEISHLAVVVNQNERREGADLSGAVVLKPDQLIYGGDHDITVEPYSDI